MTPAGTNLEANKSLARFLLKLKILKSNAFTDRYCPKEGNPIAYFKGQGLLDEEQAIQTVAKALDLPYIQINFSLGEKAESLIRDPNLKNIAPMRWENIQALPVSLDESGLTIAMANPLNYDARSAIEFDIGIPVKIAIAKEHEIMQIASNLDGLTVSKELREILEASQDIKQSTSNNDEDSSLEEDLEAAPVVRLVNKIFFDAVHSGGSDIHITPQKDSVSVRVRVDGIMRTLFDVPPKFKNAVSSRIKLLAKMDIAEKRKPQDGRIKIKTGHGVKDLRVSTVPAMYGENIVARILSSEVSQLSYDQLGLPKELQEKINGTLKNSSRVLLVSGPTGSGKTSSLYSFLSQLCDGEKNIVTVEDPIEYRLEAITQIQVNPKIGMSFAQGLRAILRQDPDVVMLGEIRDEETASIALQAAQTGHLVLSTIHTNSAEAAVTRLFDLDIPPYLVASSLGAVLAQRLVRRLCECATTVSETDHTKYESIGLNTQEIREASGCEECGDTGYAGRVGVYSLLEFNDSVREAVKERSSEVELAKVAETHGYKSLQSSGLELVEQGVTSLEELERVLGNISIEQKKSPPSNTQKQPENPGLQRHRILLVEDDTNMRRILKAIFEQEMFEVLEASNGVEALEYIYNTPPTIVVSDIMMPKMNGIDLLTRVRKDVRLAELPVLLLTAVDSDENELAALNLGVDDFVSKTASKEVMLARVHKLIRTQT